MKATGHTNPGPGNYKNLNFADKKTAPKFGFGSSMREKDYIGLAKQATKFSSPGPGAYKIPVHVSKVASYAG